MTTLHRRLIATVATKSPQLLVGKDITGFVLDKLAANSGIILWDYNGMWGMISRKKVQELQRRYEDTKAAAAYPRSKVVPVTIHHTDTIEVPLSIARNLWS